MTSYRGMSQKKRLRPGGSSPSEGPVTDYSGMTYEKLIRGSGIQWPCNEQNPIGTERLYTDGKFFTDIDYCESFRHDLETGAPYTLDQYRAMNPVGRTILKSCQYAPPIESPSEEFPLMLSTGRKVHHFHTRTKVGRTQLQTVCPEPELRISKPDAAKHNIADREMVVIRSTRGAVQMKASIGGIKEGQVFMPFHFG